MWRASIGPLLFLMSDVCKKIVYTNVVASVFVPTAFIVSLMLL